MLKLLINDDDDDVVVIDVEPDRQKCQIQK